MRIPLIALVVLLFILVKPGFAQEGLVWTDSVVEYRFDSPSDSIPLHSMSNYVLEEDSATHIHFSSTWDPDWETWITGSKSVGIYDSIANTLEMQHFFREGNDNWTGSYRSLFWYGPNGEIAEYRTDRWDGSTADKLWVRQDSTTERWESDSLLRIREKFSWSEDSLKWIKVDGWATEKVPDGEGLISLEYQSRLDTTDMKWDAVSVCHYEYDTAGILTARNTSYWIEQTREWFEYIRQNYRYDELLDMQMEEKYLWDFWTSDWELSFVGGVSDGEEHGGSYIIGIKDNKLHRWQLYEKVESEVDTSQMVTATTVQTKRSMYGVWENKSHTSYYYKDVNIPVRVVYHEWNGASGGYEIASKKIFYYPRPAGIPTKLESNGFRYELYPNPASSMVHIVGPEDQVEVSVFNRQGLLIRTTSGRELDVSYLPPGLYFVRINDGVGNGEILRFIKL